MENTFKIIYLDSVKREQTRWLWEPFIPRGKVTIVQGDPGEGKSTLMLAIAAAVTRGMEFPDFTRIMTAPDLVLYQNAEDGLGDTVCPRLDAAGADSSMVYCCEDRVEPLSISDGRFAQMVLTHKPALAVLDPLQAFLGSEVDMHRANEIRPVMSFLAAVAEKSGTAVVLVGHMNKMQDSKAIYRGLGSVDLTAAARSVLLVARDPAHEENRVILQIKNSLAPMAKPCAFTVRDGKFVWLGDYDITADKLLHGQSAPHLSAFDRAVALLKNRFAEPATDILQTVLINDAAEQDVSESALKRAKKELGLRSVKKAELWYWTNRMFDTVAQNVENCRNLSD